jgi:hypothetical protein
MRSKHLLIGIGVVMAGVLVVLGARQGLSLSRKRLAAASNR